MASFSFHRACVSPVWLAAGFPLLFLPLYWVLAQLEPYASRTADETSFDVLLVRMVSLLVPYTVWVFFRGLARVQLELRALRPVLGLSADELGDLAGSLT